MSKDIKRREFLKFLLTSGFVLTGLGSASTFMSGCQEVGREDNFRRTYDFLDHLDEAEIVAPEKDCVQRSAFTIEGEKRGVLFEHPDSQVTFKDVPIYENARLAFGIGINEAAWGKYGDGVLFEVIIIDEKVENHRLYSRYIDPKKNPEDRKWFDEVVDLAAFAGRKASFMFKTSSGPQTNRSFDWAGWSKPQLLSSEGRRIRTVERTNVILITADTLRADYLNCYGMKNIVTKNIDTLANQGVLFTNCFCQSTTTNPSHASILTSLYVKDHRVYSNSDYLSEQFRRLPEDMLEQNIITFAAVSAPHLNPKVSGFGKGFDTFIPCGGVPARAAATNKEVFHLLRKNRKHQFFMWVHYFDPHAPYTPPEGYNQMYYQGNPRDPDNKTMDEVVYPKEWIGTDYIKWLNGVTDIHYPISQYMGEVTYLDEQIGLLMQKVGQLGLENKTMIIFTSDHGESLGEHNIYYDHAGLYEPTVRIPLIIWCPKKFHKKVVDDLVMSVDIRPTVLDFFNLICSPDVRGKSLLGMISGDKETLHKQVFSEHAASQQAMLRKQEWKYIKSLADLFYTSKFSIRKCDRELYRLDLDPEELTNVAKESPGILKKMDQQLVAWLNDKKELAGPIEKPEVSEEIKEKLKSLGYAH